MSLEVSGTPAVCPTLDGQNPVGTSGNPFNVNLNATSITDAALRAAAAALTAALIVNTLITGQAGITVTGGAVSLTGNAASALSTSAGPLTLTSAAAATWSTVAGNLTVQGAAALNLNGVTALNLQFNGTNVAQVGSANALSLLAGLIGHRTAVADGGSHAYAALATDCFLGIGTTTAAFTVTLPGASPPGTVYVVKDEAGTAATRSITIQAASGTVEGAASVTISANGGVLRFYSDGVNYREW